jgi:N-acyl-D-amino-acid deacylase
MPPVDLLLRGGTVIDGTGGPRRIADVAVDGGRITAVGALGALPAARVVDARGLVVAPGFIDVHTHDDRLLLAAPDMAPKVSQGVTTVIVGNCGISLAPLGDAAAVPPINLVADPGGERFGSFAAYLAALEARPAAINCAALVGHTTLRAVSMADLSRPANDAQIAVMQGHVREALAAGAIGVSTGTYYAPAAAATVEEVRQVFAPLRGTSAVIASHIRDEADGVLGAMREVFAIASDLGVRQVVSHHKVIGRANFGRSRETLAAFDAARHGGDVCLDCYPYAASSTILTQAAAKQALRVLVAWSTTRPAAAGRYLDELAAEARTTPEAMIDALQPAGAIYFSMDEADVERILQYPETMVGSDGLPHDVFPHPRLWGAFPRVLGHYARERGLFSLEAAVHKMTGLPASRFGLEARGRVEPGCQADLTLFDPARILDRATFAQPTAQAAGIAAVFVNGIEAWHDGESTGARAGQVIRRPVARR